MFSLTWCFLVFALLSMNLSSLQWRVVGGLIALPAFVVAAAMVRHPFIALAVTLVATAKMGSRRQIAVAGVVGLSIVIGLVVRPSMSGKIIGLVVENAQKPVVACDTEDTFAIRIILAKEALNLLPKVGLLGQGIGTFAQQSCYKTEPHNVCTASRSRGWCCRSAAFGCCVRFGGISAAKRTHSNPAASFVLAGLIFVGIEFLMSGSPTSKNSVSAQRLPSS
ncbi:hypothetical protein ABIC03_002176 [Bradyrhizobium sp. RT6a]|uniref:hypothetical protein n=1 Tax=Bradyrhizobium sp. RT6a TaxID=3156381 RepID=UPI0033931C9B